MNSEIIMVRHNLDDLPPVNLAGGFSLRFHGPGDDMQWVQIQQLSDQINVITSQLFPDQFGRDPTAWSQRILYLVDDFNGQPVGTIAAWYGEEDQWKSWGRIHWVAVIPEYQGRGLSKPLLAAALRRLRALGHSRAYLTTSAQRPAALHLYKCFGFREYT
ncbi:MAG: GNAT family N-acetyltransferase [Candidatus Sumerlaeaceae bacterium]|nr:GNAT family N-acetyltransferase [Candidatus Sumerlaeaceae bacterium]